MIEGDGRNFIDYVMYTTKIKTQRIQRSMPEPVGSPAVTESEKSTKRGQKTIAACWHRDEVATGVQFRA